MSKKDKQYAVIGLGRFGTSVATTLAKAGYDVLAIDSNEERVQQITDIATHAIVADTTDENALRSLGLRNFDVVVVGIGEDMQANVLTTLVLKELGVKYLVVKARNELHGKMLEKIGADRIVYPERDMGQRVANNLISTNVLDYIELSPDLSLVEVNAPKHLVGKSLAEANLRAKYEINVVAIKQGSKIIIPPLPTDRIQDKDILIIVGSINGLRKLEDLD